MGEICKDPGNEAKAAQQPAAIERNTNTIAAFIRAEGAAQTVRYIQYALEALAAEITRGEPGPQLHTAAKYLEASEALEEAYWKIRNDLRL